MDEERLKEMARSMSPDHLVQAAKSAGLIALEAPVMSLKIEGSYADGLVLMTVTHIVSQQTLEALVSHL